MKVKTMLILFVIGIFLVTSCSKKGDITPPPSESSDDVSDPGVPDENIDSVPASETPIDDIAQVDTTQDELTDDEVDSSIDEIDSLMSDW